MILHEANLDINHIDWKNIYEKSKEFDAFAIALSL